MTDRVLEINNILRDYLSGNKTMSMYVKTDVSVTVQITLENKTDAQPSNYPTGRHSVYLDTTSGSGEWEKLTFKFDLQPDPTVSNLNVDQMAILFNPENYTSDVFYIDDIMGPEFKDPCEEVEPIDSIGDNFDCHRNVSFDFSNGDNIALQCSDWSKEIKQEYNWINGISVAILTSEFVDWITDY